MKSVLICMLILIPACVVADTFSWDIPNVTNGTVLNWEVFVADAAFDPQKKHPIQVWRIDKPMVDATVESIVDFVRTHQSPNASLDMAADRCYYLGVRMIRSIIRSDNKRADVQITNITWFPEPICPLKKPLPAPSGLKRIRR